MLLLSLLRPVHENPHVVDAGVQRESKVRSHGSEVVLQTLLCPRSRERLSR